MKGCKVCDDRKVIDSLYSFNVLVAKVHLPKKI